MGRGAQKILCATMRAQDAVDAFRVALELAPSEAAMYVHLCMAGPAKAGDLAGALKLHRNEVYRNAARLLSRGIVEMTMERPARYAAVRPERVFEQEIAQRLASIEDLKAARVKVAAILDVLEPPRVPERRSVYKVVQGRPEIGTALNHVLEHARESITWASTFPASVRLAEASGALDVLARRLDEGVQVRAGMFTDPAGWALLTPLLSRAGAQARELDFQGDVRFVIADGTELLMWVVNDPGISLKAKDEVAIQTTAPGFVQAESVFFEQAWARAKTVPHIVA